MHYLFTGLPLYSKSELIIRMLIFVILTLILWNIIKPANILWIMLILILSHSINWIFNGHGYQILYESLRIKYAAYKAEDYVLRLRAEAERRGLHVMIYGSWSRGEATRYSDIDIFIVNVHESLSKGLRLCLTSLKYRLLAITMLLSIDIYVIDRLDYLNWRNRAIPKENPIILNDPTGTIKGIYGEKETKLEDFISALVELYEA